MRIKKVVGQKRIECQNGLAGNEKLFNVDEKLILTRFLGHKDELPGSGQWRLLTEPKDDCWICDKYIYGYILWYPGLEQEKNSCFKTDLEEKTAIARQI